MKTKLFSLITLLLMSTTAFAGIHEGVATGGGGGGNENMPSVKFNMDGKADVSCPKTTIHPRTELTKNDYIELTPQVAALLLQELCKEVQ